MERISAKTGQRYVEPSPSSKVAFLASVYLGFPGFFRLLLVLGHEHIYFAADVVHFMGVFFLAIALIEIEGKTCAGLSLKSLLLTALHLGVKVLVESSYKHMFDIGSFFITLGVICLVRFKFKSPNCHGQGSLKLPIIAVDNQDNFNMLYLLNPCALLLLAVHPAAFCCYIQSVSLLPQLQLMRRKKIVEPLTASYMFMLGAQRLLWVESWFIEILLTQGQSLITFLGYNNIWWAFMGVIFEIVNGLILVDFCYYYIIIDFEQEHDIHLPSTMV